jgi:hypothetical protein
VRVEVVTAPKDLEISLASELPWRTGLRRERRTGLRPFTRTPQPRTRAAAEARRSRRRPGTFGPRSTRDHEMLTEFVVVEVPEVTSDG